MPEQRAAGFSATLALRQAGIRTEADYQGRSLKSQFKQADKVGARLCLVLGSDELAQGTVTLRDMAAGEQESVARADVVDRVRQAMGIA